jgi:hypothetical protein
MAVARWRQVRNWTIQTATIELGVMGTVAAENAFAFITRA